MTSPEQRMHAALAERVNHRTYTALTMADVERAAAEHRRRRARGAATMLGSAAAVVAVTVGLLQVIPRIESDQQQGTDQGPSQPAAVDGLPTDGFRLVGMGGAAIAVPDDWPRNRVGCSEMPQRTTYAVDTADGEICAAIFPFPKDTDAVEVQSLATQDTTGWTSTQVDGVEALRSPSADTANDTEPSSVTSTSVAIPSAGVVFKVSSSIDPNHVEDLLQGIVILENRAGVPGLADLIECRNSHSSKTDTADVYVQRLQEAGLVAEISSATPQRRCTPGTVLSVEPVPGTVVNAGSTVKVRVAK